MCCEEISMNIKKISVSLSVALAVTVLPSLVSMTPYTNIGAAYASDAPAKKTKRVPALRNKVYSQLARAQKLADDGQVAEGLAALDTIKSRSGSMNAYEVAMMHNFYGFIYYNENQLDKAIASFEQVIAQEQIPESLRQSTTFSLAQLAMANNQYDKVIGYLDKWHAQNTKPITNNYYVLRAQAFYQQKQYQPALESINVAIGLAESKQETPKENWLVLQRALYYSLNQPEQVALVLEKMVKLYNKPQYWVQLAGMYGEIGDSKKQLAIFEAAHQQGFVKSKSEVMQLAQVYMYNGLSFKAASTLKQAIESGTVESSAQNEAFIAEALVQAKEDEKAIQHFKVASQKVAHGNYDQRLAEIFINLEKFDEAADFARSALDKGQLSFEANAYVALGMAQYNLENFDASILAFEQAEKHKKSARLAKQWIKYVKKEKLHFQTLKQSLL